MVLGGPLVALVVYVLSEDDYRDNGISRWHAYGPDARAAFWITTALVLGALGALVLGEVRRVRRLRQIGVGLAVAAAVGFLYAFVAFTAN
jgi:LytS/YehU family sensor histidine kinase